MRIGATVRTVDLLVALGMAASLVLVATTAMMNWRFGYKLGGDDQVERQLFAWGLLGADVVKALMPFSLALAVRKRDWLAGSAAAAIFAVATVSSFYAGIGLGSEHRLANEGANTATIDRRAELRAGKERLEARIAAAGPLPSPAVVEREIEAAFAKPVQAGGKSLGNFTDRCRRSMVAARAACAEVAMLQVKLAAARDLEGDTANLRQVHSDLTALDSKVQSADPQLDVLERVAKWADVRAAREDIRTGLLLFLGLLLELGSGLGLYAVTTPWRHRERGAEGTRMTTTVGDAVVYADERLRPERGGRLTANVLYADYEGWCRKHNYVPVREGIFAEQMVVLAKDIGIPMQQSGSNLEFCDVGLGG